MASPTLLLFALLALNVAASDDYRRTTYNLLMRWPNMRKILIVPTKLRYPIENDVEEFPAAERMDVLMHHIMQQNIQDEDGKMIRKKPMKLRPSTMQHSAKATAELHHNDFNEFNENALPEEKQRDNDRISDVRALREANEIDHRYLKKSCLKKTGKVYEHRTYPRSYEHAGFEASLPREWDWRNVSGVNYCSPNRNQHIPVYCGSCWIFGTLGALNDRFNVARKNRWPMTMLSPQEVIACGGIGSCDGGDSGGVFEYAKTTGLVEEGCNNYKAVNEECTAFTRCGSCWPDNCFAISNYTRYYVKDYGVVRGRLNMMAEIHNRGPIVCSIGVTDPFELNYTGGIYRELSDIPSNHMVSVTGWGYDKISNTEYWIVRNSWGDAWGEKGWFRLVTSLYMNGRGDMYNMGIERECLFADPDVSNLDN